MDNFIGPEIAGALARFWTAGQGPSHASIASALALAGYEEPLAGTDANKEQRVLMAVREADEADVHQAKLVVEELLTLLRSVGSFDYPDEPKVVSLRTAFKRRDFSLSAEGYVDWWPVDDLENEETISTVERDTSERDTSESLEAPSIQVATIPSVDLLVSSLRRIAYSFRPLVIRRRGRTGMTISDEYDLQDLVESLLKSLYNDVRSEERTPSYAGSSSVMDFLLKDEAVAVEVKVTAVGRLPKQVKTELLVDISDYKQHPSVSTLLAVVYDLAASFNNPIGFERDLSGEHDGLEVRVLVVGWPLP
jgi:hypothetical protein